MAKKELSKDDAIKFIGIGFCQPKFYKPSVWKKAKCIMDKLCQIPESGVSAYDFGRGKGKYISDNSKNFEELANLYLTSL